MSWITPKRLGIVLVLSLSLNVFLIGVMVGSRSFPGRYGPDRPPHHDIAGPIVSPRGMHKMIRDLPDEKRDAARAIMEQGRTTVKSRMDEMRAARKEVRKALRADPLDKAALEQALANVRMQGMAMQETFHAGLADMAEILDVEERKRTGPASALRRFHLQQSRPSPK